MTVIKTTKFVGNATIYLFINKFWRVSYYFLTRKKNLNDTAHINTYQAQLPRKKSFQNLKFIHKVFTSEKINRITKAFFGLLIILLDL